MPAPAAPPSHDRRPRRKGRLRRMLARRLAWLLLAGGLTALVTLLTLTQPMPRFDRMLQDNASAEMRQPPSQEIVIVAIDEQSIAAIGRWPWRRALHAELLRRIAADNPRCIGLDLLLTEADLDHPGDDEVLATGIADSGCVVLPMALQSRGTQQPSELLPLPALAQAAAAIGHAHLSLDEDGVVRSVYLREGFAGRGWPHFALALQQAAQAYAGGPPPTGPAPRAMTGKPSGPWERSGHEAIVFTAGSAGTPPFKTVSYIDVLRGQVPPGTFRGRYVLVGATAAGLGDLYATATPHPTGLMPGVEIFASVLQALLHGRQVVVASPTQDLAYNLVPMAVALLGLLWLRPLAVVALICALLAVRLGLHNARPWIGIQFTPASGFLGLLLVYPLWSLMRLTAALRYLRWGTEQLNEALDGLPVAGPPKLEGDFLDRQMTATSAAGLRMRDLHRFVRDGIDQMADATLVLDLGGHVFIANLAAARHWNTTPQRLVGRDAHELLADLRWRTTGAPMLTRGALRSSERQPILGEGEDALGRILLLRCVPFFDARNRHAGWMSALVDITAMRQAQSQRDEALRFISHDIREPSASILTAVELARTRPEVLGGAALLQRIERHAQTGLELADGFVNLARAEAQPFHAEVLDVASLLQQAIDNAWAHAHKKQVQVRFSSTHEEAYCIADRSLLTRAFTNVLSNALKYSPTGAELDCSVRARENFWAIAVRDHGPGIPPALQSQLFQPFHRLHRETHPEVHGVGLGLLLVRTAVQRHGGTIEIDSAADAGCTVTLVLPRPSAADMEALGHPPHHKE
ncbi:CHASE2 domain-containing protein [Variovorax sp. UMC13]|uniref:CHASE2 domain-containing protein n=1 Tax=Variovorax sp. UMC13 TaxID=1862326 RepID=UPI001601085E|nr:CHASE2 domain-containing protein [Variovorax sp. UMC13]